MKTATVRDLRNAFAKVSAWIEAGETVQVTKAGRPFARLVPEQAKPCLMPEPRPDYLARLREHFGDFILTDEAYAQMMEGSSGERRL